MHKSSLSVHSSTHTYRQTQTDIMWTQNIFTRLELKSKEAKLREFILREFKLREWYFQMLGRIMTVNSSLWLYLRKCQLTELLEVLFHMVEDTMCNQHKRLNKSWTHTHTHTHTHLEVALVLITNRGSGACKLRSFDLIQVNVLMSFCLFWDIFKTLVMTQGTSSHWIKETLAVYA